ncbi:hypothetical protein T492DRAFT_1119821 [Pavlovales sp. CCMP2436]|nr:hypothetical protein T492DRAFT_1119821 [Pavlovales sp. CCMP2436]
MMAADVMSDTPFDSVWSNAGLVELIYEYLGADGALHELAMLSCMCSVTHAVPWPRKALVDSSVWLTLPESGSYFHKDCSADRIDLAFKALGAACSDALARPSPTSAETAFRACTFVGAALGHKNYIAAKFKYTSTLPSQVALVASHVSALFRDSTLDDPFRVVALTCFGWLVFVLGQSTEADDRQTQLVVQQVRGILQGVHDSLLSAPSPSLKMGSAALVATATFALSEMEIEPVDYRFMLHPAACVRHWPKLLVLITTTKRFSLAVRGRAFQALAFAINRVVVQDRYDAHRTVTMAKRTFCSNERAVCFESRRLRGPLRKSSTRSPAPRRLLAYAKRLAICSTKA